MRFSRIDVLPNSGRVSGARGAVETWSERSGLLLRLVTRDGRVGQGEASPLPRYSPDTLEAAKRALEQARFEALPLAERGEAAQSYLERLAAVTESLPPSAAFALETALLDLVGQDRGTPIWALLGDAPEEPVPLCTFIGGADDMGVVEAAATEASNGAHTLKVKIGGPVLGPALAVLERIRRALGDRPLRLDANRTFTTDTVAAALEHLAPLEPELVEEPAPLAAVLPLLASPVALALDESLQDPAALERVAPHVDRLRYVALVLKPMALGGFSGCLRLARRARSMGLDVTVSHLFDGPIALAAAAHLALAIGSRTRASGLAPHGGLQAWPRAPLPFLDGTSIRFPSTPGLGLAPLMEPT